MKLTIDSGEPLADVLQVIGSMYGITLTTADGSAAPAAGERPSKRFTPAKSSTSTSTSTKRRKQTETAQVGSVDPKLVRQWAWENGYEISTRGSLPAAVRDAYLAAHPS